MIKRLPVLSDKMSIEPSFSKLSENKDSSNPEMADTQEHSDLLDVAGLSSICVTALGPQQQVTTYPLPEELKTALEKINHDAFLVKQVLQLKERDPEITRSVKDYIKIVARLNEFTDIKPDYYWFMMKLLLYIDYHKCMLDMDEYSLYEQQIIPSKFNGSNFVVHVPGLSEDRPSVRQGDIIVITQVNGSNNCISTVHFVGKDYITVAVSREFRKDFTEGQRFNIFFLYPEYCFRCTHYAVDRALMFDLPAVLFPQDCPITKVQHNQKVEWINKTLESNPEQQQAVLHILARTSFPAPYVVFGPPGTGKTSTLVEAICQILRKNPSNRILVCTPSNAAADEIALRLLKNDIQERILHRMYSMSRSGNDVCEALKTCSNMSEDKSLQVPETILKTKKIVITTLITCHRLISYQLRENHFSYVFIDEAGQATEPETLIPITLLSSRDLGYSGRIHGQLVIAGDPKQLGPSIQSRIAEPLLGCSMLERLMNRKLYSKNDNNEYNSSYVTKLVRNYRCHGSILRVPNDLFYDGELKAIGGIHTERALNWPKLPNPNFPVIFHAINGNEERENHSPSVYNSAEVANVVAYVKNLLNSPLGGRKVLPNEVGIVTPYKLQRQKILDELKNAGYPDVAVGTVETFQGQEKDVIIISTVRSLLYRHNFRVHIGFLSNPKRFNVAITRAKALLIVLGNPTVLQVDDNWRYFMSYCLENNACTGVGFNLRRRSDFIRMRSLFAKKHVPEPTWEPNMAIHIEEEAPRTAKEFILPNVNSQRRRRFPRLDENSDTDFILDDESRMFTENPESRLADEDCIDIWDLVNQSEGSYSGNDYEDEDDEDNENCEESEDSISMEGIFSEDESRGSGSSIDQKTKNNSSQDKDSVSADFNSS